MLKQRILTAVAMASVFAIVLIYAPFFWFAAIVGIVTAVAAFEWANLCHLSSIVARITYAAVMIFVALFIQLSIYQYEWITLDQVLIFSCIWWSVALLWIQGYPNSAVLWRSVWARCLIGFFVLIPAWLSLTYLRQLPNGHWFVFLIVLTVAVADVGAYFSGKRFGKRKLAPLVSPGKSWEGVFGGVLAVVLGSLALSFISNFPLWGISSVLVITALVSVIGDLFESMLKRYRGIKDSGNILPGHGGVLDRVDGLVAAAPVFTLAIIVAQQAGY